MKITRLKDHALILATSDVFREFIAKNGPDEHGATHLATYRESYAIQSFRATNSILRCIDQLHFSTSMLSGYRKDSAPKNMDRYDYIVFGIENYYLRLTSVLDRCLQLTNIIFQLGIPEWKCNTESILKGKGIKATPVADSLTSLSAFTLPFRDQRNTVAHQSSYSEKVLDHLGSYYHLEKEDDNIRRHRHVFKQRTDNFIAEKKSQFYSDLVELENLVGEYLDAIHSVFEVMKDGSLSKPG